MIDRSVAIRILAENSEDVQRLLDLFGGILGDSARGTPIFANTREPGFRAYLNISLEAFERKPNAEIAESFLGFFLPRCPVCLQPLQQKIASASIVCEGCDIEYKLREARQK